MDQPFLEKDVNRAEGEKCCIYTLAVLLVESVEQNKFYLTEKHLHSMLKSNNELKRMMDKAQEQARLKEAASHLINSGSTDEVIRRFSRE